MKKEVLFICIHNSARSQMAEGLLNAFYGNRYTGYSAGLEVAKVNPYAVEVMREIGIDISKQHSKSIEKYRGRSFDYVVTVCDHAKEACPFFPGERILHTSFEDPAKFKGSQDEILKQFRHVRDKIKHWIEKTFAHP